MMEVVRVKVHAPVTSFRHPFFVTGRQPTFLMPPPSTVFGHCACALGRWTDPKRFFYGIHFQYKAISDDLEHQHITEAMSPRTRLEVETTMGSQRATTSITIQPVRRDFLFGVDMTLYLPTGIGEAFRSPVNTMFLGRSQDLAEVVSVENVRLEKPAQARIEHTLLPFALRPCVRFGATILLTRYISDPPERSAQFERYIVLHEPVFFGIRDSGRRFLEVEGISLDGLWCDPTVVDDNGFPRGFWLHKLVEE